MPVGRGPSGRAMPQGPGVPCDLFPEHSLGWGVQVGSMGSEQVHEGLLFPLLLSRPTMSTQGWFAELDSVLKREHYKLYPHL